VPNESPSPIPQQRILLAEDDPHIREILVFQLQRAGYDVIECPDGDAALSSARSRQPDLALLDVMMPGLDGYEVCKRMRASFLTRHIPIIFLTAKAEQGDRMAGLSGGANDYVVKPFDMPELLQRIRNALEWSRQQRSASPLTGLPGNLTIDHEIKGRLARKESFALLNIDIDSFKSFNDYYGYARGDGTIQALTNILVQVAQEFEAANTFVGHIGGDDFVVLTNTDVAGALAEKIVREFDRVAPELYDVVDRERGHVEVLNRRHVIERFPLMTLTIALVSTDRYEISHQAELNDVAQELKEHGKSITGSVVVGERRGRGDAREDTTRRVA
jgi:diguanylate cyclase (GGDEF)-like protein